MNAVDLLGYLASLLVLATFCMRDIVLLRALAIASNLAFMGYGAFGDLPPVLLLHVLLLPVNVLRLAQGLGQCHAGSRRRGHGLEVGGLLCRRTDRCG